MTNSISNTQNPVRPPIKASKEPFCKDMIEASNKIKTKLNPEPSQSPTTITISDTLLPKFDPSKITDQELLKLCQQYGNNSKAWKRKFEELLPEVLKRRLYKKHKFVSIYEFSAKLCGLSHESVDNVLRIYRQLEDKPILKSLVVEYGWSKLRIVASIATKETDHSWAEKVRVLPSSSLIAFVRDLKRQEEKEKIEKLMNNSRIAKQNEETSYQERPTDQKDSQRTELDNKNITSPIFGTENLTETRLVAHFSHPNLLTSLANHYQNSWPTILFKLSPETHFRLRKLKARIEKGKKEKISFNQLFETMLDIIENKEKIVKRKIRTEMISPLVLSK